MYELEHIREDVSDRQPRPGARHDWKFHFAVQEVLAAARVRRDALYALTRDTEYSQVNAGNVQLVDDLDIWIYALDHMLQRTIKFEAYPTIVLTIDDVAFFGLHKKGDQDGDG